MATRLPGFDAAEVLVVGDLMLDRYFDGDVQRISPEAPVPVVNVRGERARCGGAANVAMNLVALGARCTLVGLIGDDAPGRDLQTRLESAGVNCALLRVPGWPTVMKLRVTSRQQQLMRLDFEAPLPSDAVADTARMLADLVAEHLPRAAAVVFADYDKGALAQPEALLAQVLASDAVCVVDPKLPPLTRWRGVDVLKPNLTELRTLLGPWSSEDDLVTRSRAMLTENDIGALLLTRGEEGMTLITAAGEVEHLPAHAREVFDITGAGDTVAATLGAALAVGTPLAEAAALANVAAGIAVGHAGSSVVSAPELLQALAGRDAGGAAILNRVQLDAVVTAARQRGERIAFTNGCFDILHAGHVAYLQQAATLADRLIVAVNDDASVTRLKGPGRPVNSLAQRMRVLAGLDAVDWVTSFAEDTPETLLAALRPDVLVKGGDYGIDAVVGAELVRSWGGEVRVVDQQQDLSTSAIVERIRQPR